MKGQGIHHTFWCNSRMKASTSDQTSKMSFAKNQHEKVQSDEGDCSVAMSSVSNQSDDRTKRQKLHSTEVQLIHDSTMKPPKEPLFQSAKDVGRVWRILSRKGSWHHLKSVQFTIVSYNVLADSLLHSHPVLYDNCEEWVLHWEYRKKNLLKEILFYDADILCLQEVQETHYDNWFQPELSKAGYQGLYKKRTGDKEDGCAVFYRSDKFELLYHHYLNYKMDHVPVMNRDNIAILAILHPKFSDGQTCYKTALCIANTHLLFNRNRGDIKLLQLATLFAEIDQLKSKFLSKRNSRRSSIQNMPVILCGDFNMTPLCDLYKYITKGYLDYKDHNKKDMSGQNFVVKHGYYGSSRDCLRGNIIPQEMGLTNMSTWLATSDQTVSSSDSANYDNEWPSLTNASSSSFVLPVQEETVSQLHAQACSAKPHGRTYQDMENIPMELPKPVQFDPNSTVIRHRLFFSSVYRHFLERDVCEVTTYHEQEPSCTVDYFFDSPGRDNWCYVCKDRHKVMERTGCLSLLSEEHVSSLGGLPSKILSSDHLALVASFALHL